MNRALHIVCGVLLCGTLAHARSPENWLEQLTGMPFVALPKGCFQMGAAAPVHPHDKDFTWKHLGYRATLSADELPQHEVCLDAFWIGKYEVRANDWMLIMGAAPPDGSGTAPAAGISWNEAQIFAQRLTALNAQGDIFRLPTEAEWEYACRAGVAKEEVPGPHDLIDIAWYSAGERRRPSPSEVGQLKPNAWGLYDMLGNVWEWVQDSYQTNGYAQHRLYNPVQLESDNGERLIRGASHRSEYLQVRCATRSHYTPGDALAHIGLRLVRSPK